MCVLCFRCALICLLNDPAGRNTPDTPSLLFLSASRHARFPDVLCHRRPYTPFERVGATF